MRKVIICFVLLSIFSTISLAQNKYDVMLNRPDITGLTGGTATDLDGIPTTGLAAVFTVCCHDSR